MKYWMLEGYCTPAHKTVARQNGARIVDARFKDQFKGKENSIFKPTKEDLAAIESINNPAKAKPAKVPTEKK